MIWPLEIFLGETRNNDARLLGSKFLWSARICLGVAPIWAVLSWEREHYAWERMQGVCA